MRTTIISPRVAIEFLFTFLFFLLLFLLLLPNENSHLVYLCISSLEEIRDERHWGGRERERKKTESLSIIFFHQLILNGTRSISSATVIPGIEFAPRRILVTSRPTLESYEILSFSPFFFSFRCTDFSHFDLFHRNGRSSGIREFTRAWCERSIDFILPMSDFDGKLFFGPRIILRPSCTTPTEIHSRSTFPWTNDESGNVGEKQVDLGPNLASSHATSRQRIRTFVSYSLPLSSYSYSN